MKKKISIITLLIAIVIVMSNNISYGTGLTSDPQIKTRGLVFSAGKSSDQIRMLKDFFRAKGEANVSWGYNYDNRTRELVSSYQRQVGLGVDGIVGRSTLDRINRDIRDNNVQIGLRVPHINVKGNLILINKSSNTLYLLNNGIVQDSYPVATGKTAYLTPNGKFKIVNKFINPAWGGGENGNPVPGGVPHNPLGTRWMGLDYGGGGKYGVHGNSNPSSIGTYASLGCVRMFNGDVENLFGKVNTGTPIWIGSEELLESYGVSFKSNYIAKKVEQVAPPKPVNLRINGESIQLKDPVIIKEGTSYHPFREILELISAEVFWDSENKIAKGILGENYVEFQLNNNEYKNNDNYRFLPGGQKVFIEKDRTYVPIRNLMEGLGFEVSWEDSTRTIIINEIIPEEEIEEIIEDEVEKEDVTEDEFTEEKMKEEEIIEDKYIKEEIIEENINDEIIEEKSNKEEFIEE